MKRLGYFLYKNPEHLEKIRNKFINAMAYGKLGFNGVEVDGIEMEDPVYWPCGHYSVRFNLILSDIPMPEDHADSEWVGLPLHNQPVYNGYSRNHLVNFEVR